MRTKHIRTRVYSFIVLLFLLVQYSTAQNIQIPVGPDYPWIPEDTLDIDTLSEMQEDEGESLEDYLDYSNRTVSPDLTSTSSQPVLSPKGEFSVTATGGASYNYPFSLPTGVGGMTPSVGLSYNSQGSFGIAGWGCGVYGISSITRGMRDILHDGKSEGISYDTDAVYYLDGVRLIYSSGTEGSDSSQYHPEGNPFTTVILHEETGYIWFEVTSPDGLVTEYGHTNDSRQGYTISYYNITRTSAWYVSSSTDVSGNIISYEYIKDGLYVYPSSIHYGANINQSTGLDNVILFTYEQRPDIQPFRIKGAEGQIAKRLKSVSVKTGSIIYRNYVLTYNATSDSSKKKYSRLTKITEKNGSGESAPAVSLGWEYLSGFGRTVSEATTYLMSRNNHNWDAIIAVDINNDGISDIIELGAYDLTTGHEITDMRIHFSSVQINGETDYDEIIKSFELPGNISADGIYKFGQAYFPIDFDGDGLNDLIIPYFTTAGGAYKSEFYILLGKDLIMHNNNPLLMSITLSGEMKCPLFTCADVDKNGKMELISLEIAKTSSQDGYTCTVFNHVGQGYTTRGTFLTLSSNPKRLFTADYNNDGLQDLLVFYDGGYSVFFNNGVSSTEDVFTNSNSYSSTSLGWKWRMEQGDFNGDGLIDIIYVGDDSAAYYWALNNGNRTFTIQSLGDFDVHDQSMGNDDTRFTLLPMDFDADGLTDLVIAHSNYHHHGGFHPHNSYTDTSICWMRNTGTGLTEARHVVTTGEEDANHCNLSIGDFNGDGLPDLLAYGRDLYTNTTATDDVALRIYSSQGYDTASGKATSVTDEMGTTASISYKSLTDPTVYEKGTGAIFPVVDCQPAMHVVSSVTSGNGAAGNHTISYQYAGLKSHSRGRGLLGFTTTRTTESSANAVVETITDSIDSRWYIPLRTTTRTTVGNDSAQSISRSVKFNSGSNNYFLRPFSLTETDMDGNITTTTLTHDTGNGQITSRRTSFGNGMYKQEDYSGYDMHGGKWLPAQITISQKHEDDNMPFSSTCTFTYDDRGLPLTEVRRAGTPLSLTTTRTYDTIGNVLSESVSGNGINTITSYREYDQSGRFVTRQHTQPTSTIKQYTYDTWGNVLTETDATDNSNPLTTTYIYNGWGQLTSASYPYDASASLPDNSSANSTPKTTYTRGWGSSQAKKYFIVEQPTGSSWTKTWYDAKGREIETEAIGSGLVRSTSTTSYNNKGLPTRIENTTGNIVVAEDITYDARGRKSSEQWNSGRSVSYEYGNRMVNVDDNGRQFTKEYDAWGNVLTSSDPESSVTYTYSSCGKPSQVTAAGATASLIYDTAGNRTSLSDPDAGTTTYEYNAAGAVTRKTDARGVVTENTYDSLNRLVCTVAGTDTISYTYGTSGNDAMLLVSKSCNGGSTSYTYDKLGQVLTETRHMDGHQDMVTSYEYNRIGQLIQKTFPDGLQVRYRHEATSGDVYDVRIGDRNIYRLADDDGTTRTVMHDGAYVEETITLPGIGDFPRKAPEPTYIQTLNLNDCIYATDKHDNIGFLSSSYLYYDTVVLDSISYEYDGRGNLLTRTRGTGLTEGFAYDDIDRLVEVSTDDEVVCETEYSSNGNIIRRDGIGNYTYGSAKPHAVTSVENLDGSITGASQATSFNGFGKVTRIIDGNEAYQMDITYGPDQQRWKSVLTKMGQPVRTTIYADDYEEVISADSTTRRFHYLDGGAVVVSRDGEDDAVYYPFTDNLGSVLRLVNSHGETAFEAEYDAWGRQTVTTDSIGFHRGYTGHEMLPEFGLINMNGRMYDPVIGRFISPDDYVQRPDFSQSYNRYSYCLNNPLKYTDPSGNLSELIAFAAFSAINSMMQAKFNGENVWKAGALSLLSSSASYGIGEAFKGATATFGNELLRAGAHGLASGVISAFDGGNFTSSFISGAAASGIGSFAQSVHINNGLMVASTTAMGGFVAWATGGDFLMGAMQGMAIGVMNHTQHDPTEDIEKRKTMSRLRMKNDLEYKQRIIKDIQKDGMLTFKEAYYWYGYGDGSDITVDASKLELGKIDTTGKKVGDQWTVPTLSWSGNHDVGLVYGTVTVEYKGNNTFYIFPDTYNFDIHTENFFTLHTIKRNIETIGASMLHGSGTPFNIIFKGYYHNK